MTVRRLLPLFALVAVVGCGSDAEEVSVGSKAPDFTVETVSIPSSSASLKNRAGKVILLDFWATWCGPCKQIAPYIEALYEKHKADGLEVMAISDEAREIVAINEKKHPHKMPVFLDPSGKAHTAFGVRGLPTVIVIDRTGTIAFETSGFDEPTLAKMTEVVEKALETK
ncbi:TlpA family protein disulfide reductase [bacterium]|nr:MAG: TlpA family protein disulfide reductase [bacterium]